MFSCSVEFNIFKYLIDLDLGFVFSFEESEFFRFFSGEKTSFTVGKFVSWFSDVYFFSYFKLIFFAMKKFFNFFFVRYFNENRVKIGIKLGMYKILIFN